MAFSQTIKSALPTLVLVFWALISFGQITDTLQKEAENMLRQEINRLPAGPTKVITALSLARLYLCAGINKRPLLDSMHALNLKAELLGRQLRSVKWLNEVRISEAEYNVETGDQLKAEVFIGAVINSQVTTHDIRSKAHAWYTLGVKILPWSKNLLEEKILCFVRAGKLYRQLNDPTDEIGTLKSIADAHLTEGKHELAEKELSVVLQRYKAIQHKHLSDTYYLMSQAYYNSGNMHQALYYSLETIKSMKATRDSAKATQYYMKISYLYDELGMYDNAIYYDQKVLRRIWDTSGRADAVKRLIKILNKENKQIEAYKLLQANIIRGTRLSPYVKVIQNESLAICYLSLGRYRQARVFIDRLLLAAGDYHYLLNFPMENNLDVYNVICDYFLTIKNHKTAKYYLRQLQAIPKALIAPSWRADLELYQSEVDSAEGKYASALKHFQVHMFLSDSLLNVTKSKQIEELQISYETRQKDADLALLTKQSQVQQASIANKNLVTNFMIIGFVLLAIIIGGLYNRYKVNKRHNSVLEGTQREIAAKNTSLEKLLADNEWLLREVHHRVKNNLHVIMGLLNSQSAYLEDGIALNAVRDSRNRVQSMALIHQKLYMTPNATEIFLPGFVSELVDNLKDSFDTRLHILFELLIAPISMDASYVVPVGLILNEAITNSIKHAFPCSEQDSVYISLNVTGPDEVTLVIADNGRGIKRKADTGVSKSFGLQLISGLADELDGTLTIESPPGTTLSVCFKTVHAVRPT